MRHRKFASTDVGFSNTIVTNCSAFLKNGRTIKSWCTRTFGSDELTLWSVDPLNPFGFSSDGDDAKGSAYITDVPPRVVGKLTDHWSETINTTPKVEEGNMCTAVSIGIGNADRACERSDPLPGIIARGYRTGSITVSLLPTDDSPVVVFRPSDNGTSVSSSTPTTVPPHDGIVTCLQIVHRRDLRHGYILVSGGSDGAVIFWWITVKKNNIWKHSRPYFEVVMLKRFLPHQNQVCAFSSPGHEQNQMDTTEVASIVSIGDDMNIGI